MQGETGATGRRSALATVAEVARELRIGDKRVRRLIAEGELPGMVLGPRLLRVPWAGVEAYLARQVVRAKRGRRARTHGEVRA